MKISPFFYCNCIKWKKKTKKNKYSSSVILQNETILHTIHTCVKQALLKNIDKYTHLSNAVFNCAQTHISEYSDVNIAYIVLNQIPL